MRDTSKIRFHLHHELNTFYHQLFNQVADADIFEGDAASVTQMLLNSRFDALKHLVSEDEMTDYAKIYQED
ncbi:MAG: hypothetical protein WBB82_15530 [Limnothrix sp.]